MSATEVVPELVNKRVILDAALIDDAETEFFKARSDFSHHIRNPTSVIQAINNQADHVGAVLVAERVDLVQKPSLLLRRRSRSRSLCRVSE